MAETKIKYAAATPIAITATTANGVGVWSSSAIVDNTTNLYMDAMIGGSLQVGAVTAAGNIDIYAVGSWDGTEFTAGVDAGDTDITWGTTGNTHVAGENDLIFLGSVNVDATDDNNDIAFGPFNLAPAFGGSMPQKFAIVFENNTDIALHATGTNNHLEYSGITYTSA